MKRKIAFISEHASPLATLGGVDSGGQNVYVGELAKHLVSQGYEIDIFTRWDNSNLPMVINWVNDIRVIHIEAGPVEVMEKEKLYEHMPEFTSNMISFITKENISYGLIHANFWMSAMVAADIKKVLNIPFVVTFHALGYIRKIHQGNNDKFPEERIDIERKIVEEADQIIAECPQDKEDLIQYYDAKTEKITIIPCGFNPNEFYPMDKMLARMVLNIDCNEFVVLQLGRMVPRKGIDNVISAVGRLKKLASPIRLVVVGGETDNIETETNPEINRLRDIAAEEDVLDCITFAGRKKRDILKYYYAAADVFVTTPWYEPFGITPLESMACGTPVIGSNVGGIKYSVEDGKTGFLVEPNDPEMLALKMYDMFNDPALLKTMRKNALKRVNALFTWSKVSEMMASLYERTLLLNPVYRMDEDEALNFIDESFEQVVDTVIKTKQLLAVPTLRAATMMANCFRKNKKVLVCGNGGSAAESLHFVAELVGRFEIAKRQALPAIALTADTATITAWSNDVGYEDVFARQVEAYGQKGDILFCFSTSGQSVNVINAMKVALEKNMYVIAMTGKDGGAMSLYAHVNLIIPSDSTQRIQEMHLHLLHTLCSLIEDKLFKNKIRVKTSVKTHLVSEKVNAKYSLSTNTKYNGHA
ncbi:glycosyltransferase [Chryseosolibacter indicus]|uniref:Phosphoheptose isomerase n=1 Tax=Chryseosolibacter indicus TaxID=2782351 RepID=A0ABS5VSR9_9BACT|nr:glycosyltransferase [Chryseosolibacter indicus]MBT1703819.1 glycosyltransferase [Chryseosolibacter indicus]